MARRTIELFECDICHQEGDRYTIQFPDGSLALDRCIVHAKPLFALKEGPGQWTVSGIGRQPFVVSTLEEVLKQKRRPE